LALGVIIGSLACAALVALVLRGGSKAPHDDAAARSAGPSATPASTARAPSAPAPTPTAAAPTASVAMPGGEDDADVATWRARLDKASLIKDWVSGCRAFLALAPRDPTFLDDADERAKVVGVAAGIAHEGKSDMADAVFDTLASKLGTNGLEVLYDLALSRGGTRGGQRARTLLARSDVMAREPPPLRIAFEFFVANCPTRHSLLERAATVGDRRTLVQLEVAHGAHCANKKDPCCFREDPAMVDAIAKLKARLQN
jgi:serine/threonine-protein kinase